MMDRNWFEIADVRRRSLNSAVWVPLRSSQKLRATGRHGYSGYLEEFFGAGSVAVPLDERHKATTLSWRNVGLERSHRGYFEDGRYVPADVLESYELETTGTALVLDQDGNSDDPPEWHLHQDLV